MKVKIPAIIKSLRPLHWSKNFLVLAPVFFSGGAGKPGMLWKSAGAFVVFCAASSAAYLVNDMRDAASDRGDARKRRRPYASGQLSAAAQLTAAGACAAVAVAVCVALPWGVSGMAAAYVASMLLYTFALKRVWPLGVIVISLGMIARVFAGASAIDVCVSSWVIPCTFFLTAYVVTGKRIYDAANGGAKDRLLKAAFIFCGLATLGFYLFYSFYDRTILMYHTRWVSVSALPVAVGLFRYQRIAGGGRSDREHLQAVLSDPVTAVCLAAWFSIFLAIVYL